LLDILSAKARLSGDKDAAQALDSRTVPTKAAAVVRERVILGSIILKIQAEVTNSAGSAQQLPRCE